MTMTIVREVLQKKARQPVVTIQPDVDVLEAILRMARHNIGALVVTDRDSVIGVFSERDHTRRVVLANRPQRATLVRDVMQLSPPTCSPDDEVVEVMRTMTENYVRHVPVLEGGDLVGLISMGDIVKAIISDQEFLIDQLTGYVTGSYPAVYPRRRESSIEPREPFRLRAVGE